jgi:MFS family permease
MFGMLVGSFVIGLISDHFGRRNALSVSVILVSGAGTLTAFAEDNLVAFGFLRILTGMGGMVSGLRAVF